MRDTVEAGSCLTVDIFSAETVLIVFFACAISFAGGHIRYSVPEELKKGSLIGNVAQDLGLDLRRLRSGRARIVTGENTQYTELKADKGILVVNERIDREKLCGDTMPCSFSFEVILENPMELHQITKTGRCLKWAHRMEKSELSAK
uniref:Cadherin N-terminal domain-containing protein n=1 Tax=Oryzias latipes TaxID=8090 RepID=A0A3P9MCC5_ORYLA